jgi:hypothetical protein
MNFQRIVAFVFVLAVAQSAQAADPSVKAPAASPIAPKVSGSTTVSKLLAPGPADPDVPLPRAGLSDDSSAGVRSSGPQIYAREEAGGGVLGLRFRIPVNPQANEHQD